MKHKILNNKNARGTDNSMQSWTHDMNIYGNNAQSSPCVPSSASLPELGPWCLASLPICLGTVPASVRVVPGGCTDGAGVVPEDGASYFPVVRLQLVWAVHPCSLSVLPAEATKVRGSPAAAGVRQAADWTGLRRVVVAVVLILEGLDVAPRSLSSSSSSCYCWCWCWCCCCWWPLGTRVCALRAAPFAEPLQQCAQVHVVVPHVKALSVGEEATLDSSLHWCHFWIRSADFTRVLAPPIFVGVMDGFQV